MVHHPLIIDSKSGIISLWEKRRLEKINRIAFYHTRRKKFRKLKVQKRTCDAVIAFLERYHEHQDMSFDCYAFTNLIVGHTLHDKLYLLNFWKLKRYRWWKRREGKVIFLVDNKGGSFSHAAIYLGAGYYLSVHGAGGDLIVAKLPDMLECYVKAKDVMIAIPKG